VAPAIRDGLSAQGFIYPERLTMPKGEGYNAATSTQARDGLLTVPIWSCADVTTGGGGGEAMLIDLRELLDSPGSQRTYQLDNRFPHLDGIELSSPVRGVLTIRNSRRHIVVSGTIQSTAHLVCSRCLGEVDEFLEEEVEAICPIAQSAGGMGGRLAPEDAEQADLFDATYLLVDELIRQTLSPAVSMKPLCKEDCRGICAGCGVNLNEEPCRCSAREIDPRLAVLEALVGKHSRERDGAE